MNKLLRGAAAAAAAAVMLAGCSVPGINSKGGGSDKMTGSYNYSPTEAAEAEQIYDWLIRPSITADNIISFDASRIDPDNADSKMYLNYSVIRQTGKYGLIDYSGNIVIKPEYDNYYLCSCGEIVLFNAIDERKEEYEYCTVGADKKLTSYPEHTEDDTNVYYWDTATQKVFEGVRGENTVTEYTGKRAVAVTEAQVEMDDYGTLDVTVPEGALCGMAKEGQLIIDCMYDAYYAPTYKGVGSTAVAFMNASGKWGYFDADGSQIIDFICDGDPNAYNGMLNDDQMITHPFLFCDDYIPVYKDGFYSYYDFSGEQVVRSGEFAQARPVNNGRAWVKQGEYWGVIQLGDIIEEEKPKNDSSSSSQTETTTTSSSTYYWTQTSDSTESQPEYTDVWTAATDANGNPVTSASDVWTDTGVYTDTDINTDTSAWSDTAATEPVYTDAPAVTDQPVVPDQGGNAEPAAPDAQTGFFEY